MGREGAFVEWGALLETLELWEGGSVCSKNGEQRMDITAKKLGVLDGERNGYYGGWLFSDYIYETFRFSHERSVYMIRRRERIFGGKGGSAM